MLTKILWDIRNNFSLYFIKIRWILVAIIVILFMVLLFVGLRDTSVRGVFYYPQKRDDQLSWERRQFKRGSNPDETIAGIIEELLLGPMDPEMDMLFPIDTRLLGAAIDDGTLVVNLTRSSIMQETEIKRGRFTVYHVMFQSILHTAHHFNPAIKRLELLFEGESYTYVGTYPIGSGINLDYSVLKR
jgi:spore germination protein GerM